MKTVKRHWSIRILEGVIFVFLIVVLFYFVFQKYANKGGRFDESEYADGIFYADSLLKASQNKIVSGNLKEAEKMNEKATEFYRKSLEKVGKKLQLMTGEYDTLIYNRLKETEASYNFKLFLGTYENKYLNKSILIYKEILDSQKIKENPEGYGNIQFNLGNSYMFWQNENREERFGNAVKSYLEAAKYFSKEIHPPTYGQIYYNLGYAYSVLEEKDNSENLIKSLNAYGESLNVFSIKFIPERYGTVKYRRGTLFYRLSKLKDRKENLLNALKEYEDALKVRTVAKTPLQFAETKDMIGVIYEELSIFGNKKEYLTKSIDVRREALKVYVEQADAAKKYMFQLKYLPLKIKKLEEKLE